MTAYTPHPAKHRDMTEEHLGSLLDRYHEVTQAAKGHQEQAAKLNELAGQIRRELVKRLRVGFPELLHEAMAEKWDDEATR